jgi:hypothetical protein
MAAPESKANRPILVLMHALAGTNSVHRRSAHPPAANDCLGSLVTVPETDPGMPCPVLAPDPLDLARRRMVAEVFDPSHGRLRAQGVERDEHRGCSRRPSE